MRNALYPALTACLILAGCGVKVKIGGGTNAYATPVADNQAVLVHSSNIFAAFVLKNQRTSPESMSYEWYCRYDGKGVLRTNDPAVSTGSGQGRLISIKTLNIDWSACTEGQGWIYYPTGHQFVEFCVTDRNKIEGIDAASSNWTYSAFTNSKP